MNGIAWTHFRLSYLRFSVRLGLSNSVIWQVLIRLSGERIAHTKTSFVMISFSVCTTARICMHQLSDILLRPFARTLASGY